MKDKRKINLGDQVYTYELNLNAMVNFEEETGKSLINIDPKEDFSMKDIRALIWAGVNEDHEISIEEVGKSINLDNIEKISDEIMTAFDDVLPEGEENVEAKNKNRSTG